MEGMSDTAQTWEMRKDRFLSIEMHYWQRMCKISRLDHIKNETVPEVMNV